MKRTAVIFRQVILWGILWLSLLVNVYFLIVQPRTVFSLRRLTFTAGATLFATFLLWLLTRRRLIRTDWQKISPRVWWIGITLAAVLFLIAPAPSLHSLTQPVEVRLLFEPVNQEEASFYLIWLNNGLVDLSFNELELPPSAQISPQGIRLTARAGQPAEVRWRGRIWGEFVVNVRSETSLSVHAQAGSQIIKTILEGGADERTIRLPRLSFIYYAVLYLLVIALGSFSLAWAGQTGMEGVSRLNQHYPALLSRFVEHLPVIFLSGISVFYLLTLRSGHPWGDDFAQYIAHARNLAQGQPYTAIGILHNPAVVLGPTAYPPLFPLLLAPFYAVFGLNLTAFKVVETACALSALWLFDVWLRERFQAPLRALAVLLAGLHPWFWNYKDQILSDMPFVLLGMLTLVGWERWRDSRRGVKGWMVGLAMAAAIAARSVGFFLLAAVLAEALLRRRWQRRGFLPLIGIPLLAVVLLNLLLPSTGDYLDQTRGWNWSVLQENIASMISIFQDIWRGNLLHIGEFDLISVLGIGLLWMGFLFRLPHIGAVEGYFLGTLAMIVLWPHSQDVRFYLPILFFVFYYVLFGWQQIITFLRKFSRFSFGAVQKGIPVFVLAFFTAGVLHGYLNDYGGYSLQEFRAGIGLPASQQMFAYIREGTREGDVVAFFKPRALALFTGRTAFAPYWNPQQPQRLMEDLTTFQADVLVVWKPEYSALAAFARNNPAAFDLMFENNDFEVYSVTSLEP
ncbi:MAG: glycosyltransferase family 39 protein [Chloroflexota bacterium]